MMVNQEISNFKALIKRGERTRDAIIHAKEMRKEINLSLSGSPLYLKMSRGTSVIKIVMIEFVKSILSPSNILFYYSIDFSRRKLILFAIFCFLGYNNVHIF